MIDESIVETAMPPFVWQQEVWSSFCEKITTERLAHANLLAGADGVGVKELAYAMARFLLCQAPLEDIACGRCRGCELVKAGSHPDLFILRREDDATQIKVDQVRAGVVFVAKTPHFQGFKVVIVEDAETLNVNASNALLKSLEEPAGQTIFLLVTSKPSTIMPTIRSRCQKVDVLTPPFDQALAWLNDHNVEQAQGWLQQAGGAPLLAKLWAEGDFSGQQSLVYKSIVAVLEGRVGSQQVAPDWQKIDTERLISIQLSVLDGVLRTRLGGSDLVERLKPLAVVLEKVDNIWLFRLRDKLNSKLGQWRRNPNLNAVMVCEEMAMDWGALAQFLRR